MTNINSDRLSQLPQDLLGSIMGCLVLPDLLKFSCVSSSLRSVVSAPILSHKGGHVPWLIVPLESNSPEIGHIWLSCSLGFFSILDGKLYKVDIQEMKERRIFGSSNGWLLTLRDTSDLQLFHPFSKKLIHLPSLLPVLYSHKDYSPSALEIYFTDEDGVEKLNTQAMVTLARDYCIERAIVVSSYPNDELVVMGILVGPWDSLVFCRPGKDTSWTIINDDPALEFVYRDIAYYQGKYYALDVFGSVVVVEGFDSSSPVTKIIMPEHEYDKNYERCLNLVESSGDLLKVIRVRKWESEDINDNDDDDDDDDDDNDDYDFPKPYKTVGFKVLKLDLLEFKYVEVYNLGDCSLFIGFNQSYSVSASDIPGCQGNCIYFTDDDFGLFKQSWGGYDKGIYNMEDGSIQPLYPDDDSELILPRPIWYSTS